MQRIQLIYLAGPGGWRSNCHGGRPTPVLREFRKRHSWMNTREIRITSSLLIHSNTSLNTTIKTTTYRSMRTLVRRLAIGVYGPALNSWGWAADSSVLNGETILALCSLSTDDHRTLPVSRRSTVSQSRLSIRARWPLLGRTELNSPVSERVASVGCCRRCLCPNASPDGQSTNTWPLNIRYQKEAVCT